MVIRSIIYDSSSGRLSFSVGSAITYDSNPEHEYQECLLKASAILEVLAEANIAPPELLNLAWQIVTFYILMDNFATSYEASMEKLIEDIGILKTEDTEACETVRVSKNESTGKERKLYIESYGCQMN